MCVERVEQYKYLGVYLTWTLIEPATSLIYARESKSTLLLNRVQTAGVWLLTGIDVAGKVCSKTEVAHIKE